MACEIEEGVGEKSRAAFMFRHSSDNQRPKHTASGESVIAGFDFTEFFGYFLLKKVTTSQYVSFTD